MYAHIKLIVIVYSIMLSLNFGTSSSEAKEDMPNILLFTIDACRCDHFGCYGYSRDTSPNIDKLAREGVLFTNAFSQSAWTTPGIISILTSLYPPYHNVDAKGKTLRDEVLTLPKILKGNGYAAPVLPRLIDIPNYWHLGFDEVDKEQFRGAEGEDLLKLLEAYKNKRFFIWYHHHILHLPYNPPNPYDEIFRKDIVNGTSTDSAAISIVKRQSVIKNASVNFNDIEKKTVIALYDGQIRQLDDYIGQLTDKMDEWGILDNTLIFITSDHGEELFEHGFIGHASTSLNAKLYDEIIHIPLIIWRHKKSKHKIINDLVQQTDFMPTILDLLGIPIPGGLQGRSLLPLIQGKPNDKPQSVNPNIEQETIFCESILGGYQSTTEMEQIKPRCIRTKEWKLIYTNGLNGGKYELYDLKNDPKEEKNVAEKNPEMAEELKKRLSQWIK